MSDNFFDIREKGKDIKIVKSTPIKITKIYGKEKAEEIRKAILANCYKLKLK